LTSAQVRADSDRGLSGFRRAALLFAEKMPAELAKRAHVLYI
jgi:hypothetical protein